MKENIMAEVEPTVADIATPEITPVPEVTPEIAEAVVEDEPEVEEVRTLNEIAQDVAEGPVPVLQADVITEIKNKIKFYEENAVTEGDKAELEGLKKLLPQE